MISTITVVAMQTQDEMGPYTNSVGVHLPADAAPPDDQVLTTFELREWTKGNQIVLEPNPHYRGPARPYLERVVAKLYSAAAQPPFLPAYEAGEVDYILLTNQAEINRIKTDPALQSQLNTYVDFATLYLTMNT